MLEEVLFILIAFVLFMVIFSKIIRHNDYNYIALLVIQAIGIAICFIEIKIGIHANVFFTLLRYLMSILLPMVIIFLELKGINFSDILVTTMARVLIALGKDKEAKQMLLKLVEKYNDSYTAHILLAEIYEREGGRRKAIDEYVMALDLRGNDYDSYFKIARLLKELDKKDESTQMLQTLLKSKPDCLEATMLLGEILCEQERFKEAVNVYQDALKYHSAEYDLYYSLGIVLTRLNDFTGAKEMYEKAAELNHKLFGAYYNLGQICFIEGDLDEAEKYFEKCLYDEELEAMAYYGLAKVYVLKGLKEKAITFMNKAIELDPELLQKATREPVFKTIREYITVSVNMDAAEPEEKVLTDEDFMDIPYTRELGEKKAQEHLEDTTSLVREISDNTDRQKASEIVNNIINKEKLKKMLEEEQGSLDENEPNKEQKNDNI
ncbi:MAG: tetratricopeptide repeat protein [Clostridia bacterium]|nr:tetratricopeptide repeat protein [Clostridia bacterium]